MRRRKKVGFFENNQNIELEWAWRWRHSPKNRFLLVNTITLEQSVKVEKIIKSALLFIIKIHVFFFIFDKFIESLKGMPGGMWLCNPHSLLYFQRLNVWWICTSAVAPYRVCSLHVIVFWRKRRKECCNFILQGAKIIKNNFPNVFFLCSLKQKRGASIRFRHSYPSCRVKSKNLLTLCRR